MFYFDFYNYFNPFLYARLVPITSLYWEDDALSFDSLNSSHVITRKWYNRKVLNILKLDKHR